MAFSWVFARAIAVARSSLFLFLVLFSIGTRAEKPWQDSPHGPMLERIIPPGFTAAMLPEPASRGAQLTLRYCVQCHNLANPAMHDAARWPSVVRRMVPRMEGKGNMGKLMADMMAGVEAPSPADEQAIVAYLRKHAQRALDPKRIPEVNAPAARAVPPRLRPVPRAARPAPPQRRRMARGGRAHGEEHGVDEPRRRVQAGSRRAAAQDRRHQRVPDPPREEVKEPMPRKIVDLSIYLENDVVSDPPPFGPKITYMGHDATFPQMAPFFPGLKKEDLPDGAAWAVEKVELITHNGTHLDAPYHFHPTMNKGERAIAIDEVDLEWCFQPGVKLDFRNFPDGYVVTAHDVEAELRRIDHTLKPLEIVVVNTRAGSRYGQRRLRERRLRHGLRGDDVPAGARRAAHGHGRLELGRAVRLHRREVQGDEGREPDLGRATRPAATSATATSRSCTTSRRCPPTASSSPASRTRSAAPRPAGRARWRSSTICCWRASAGARIAPLPRGAQGRADGEPTSAGARRRRALRVVDGRGRAGVSRQADPHHRAVRRGQRRRQQLALLRRSRFAGLGTAGGGREPPGRQRRHRGAGGEERARRRLYAPVRHEFADHGEPDRHEGPALRADEGLPRGHLSSASGLWPSCVNASSPHKTLADLVQATRRKSGSPLPSGTYSAGYELVAAWLGTANRHRRHQRPVQGHVATVTDIVGNQVRVRRHRFRQRRAAREGRAAAGARARPARLAIRCCPKRRP